MKVIIEFNLPEEKYEYELMMKANSLLSVLQNIDDFLRINIKNNNKPSGKRCKTLEEIRSKLAELCDYYDINIY